MMRMEVGRRCMMMGTETLWMIAGSGNEHWKIVVGLTGMEKGQHSGTGTGNQLEEPCSHIPLKSPPSEEVCSLLGREFGKKKIAYIFFCFFTWKIC